MRQQVASYVQRAMLCANNTKLTHCGMCVTHNCWGELFERVRESELKIILYEIYVEEKRYEYVNRTYWPVHMTRLNILPLPFQYN